MDVKERTAIVIQTNEFGEVNRERWTPIWTPDKK